MDFGPLIMETQIINQVTKRETLRCTMGSPPTSISSVAFNTFRYQKYVVDVVRSHSGSEVNSPWRKMQDHKPPSSSPPPPPPSISIIFLLMPSLSVILFLLHCSNLLQPSHLPFSSLSSHQKNWSSSVRGTLTKAVETGKTEPNRRDSKP